MLRPRLSTSVLEFGQRSGRKVGGSEVRLSNYIVTRGRGDTQRILQKLRDNDLFVKPEKCVFWQNKVEYLGMIIKENKIGMDPVKPRGIADWPLPKTVKDV